MGRSSYDIDIACDARWELSKRSFEEAGCTVHETGVKHGTITAVVDGLPIEVTTYRSDGAYSDGRHPDKVSFVNSIEEDLARRDFTFNAIAYHPQRGLLDPFDGRSDIERRTIRSVGCAEERFGEDSLRIIRAARFQSQLGFSIDSETRDAMDSLSDGIDQVAIERQIREWDRFLLGPNVRDALMSNCAIMGRTIPEILPLMGFDQKSRYHCYDVMEHTAAVVGEIEPTSLLRWSALFHDMGKPQAFTKDERGAGHFKGHAVLGGDIAASVMKRLKFPRQFSHKVELLVRHHDDRIEPTLSHVRQRMATFDFDPDLFRCLCKLKAADAQAHHPQWRAERTDLAHRLMNIMDEIEKKNLPYRLDDLSITGADVISEGILPGPDVGRILQRVLHGVVEGRIENDRSSLLEHIRTFV